MQQKLKSADLKGSFSSALIRLAQPLMRKFLPVLLGDVFRMQKSVEQGGLKTEADDGIINVITSVGDQIILSVHPFNFVQNDKFGEGPFLKKPIKSTNLTEMIAKHLGIDVNEIHQDESDTINPIKDEEE